MNRGVPVADEKLSTRERVFEAATAMARAGLGKKISVRNIRERIGYGSMRDINDALDDWWPELGRGLVREELVAGMSATANELFSRGIEAVMDWARDQARQELELYRLEAEDRVAVAHQARDAAQEAKELVETANRDLKHQVEQLVARCDALGQQIEQERARHRAAEKESSGQRLRAEELLSQARADLAAKSAEIAGLHQQLAREVEVREDTERRLTALYDQERTARQKERGEADKAMAGLRENQDRLAQRLQDAELAKAQLSGRLEQTQDEVRSLQAARDTLTDKYSDTRAALAAAEASRDGTVKERDGFADELAATRLTVAKQEQMIAELRAKPGRK